MPECVVQLLEPVDIPDHDRNGSLFASRMCQLTAQHVSDGRSVQKPGQLIDVGLDAQMVLQSDQTLRGSQSRMQLVDVDGFAYVIIGTGLESRNKVFLTPLAGEHDHVCAACAVAFAQLATEIDAA